MIHNEQILEYIDGMLDPDSEQALFDALARQPELRSTMRQYICIGEAVRADREAYAPPAEVERSLMAGIGLSPAELGFVAPSVGIIERLWTLGGRYLGMIGAFILGVLLASVTIYLVVDFDGRGSDGAGRSAAYQGNARGGAAEKGAASSKNGTTTNGVTAASGDRGAAGQSSDAGIGAGSGSQGDASVQGGAASQGYGGSASSSASTPRLAETTIGGAGARSSRPNLSAPRTERRGSSRQGRSNEAFSPSAANDGIAMGERRSASSERRSASSERRSASSERRSASSERRTNEGSTNVSSVRNNTRNATLTDARTTTERNGGASAEKSEARSASSSRAENPSETTSARDLADVDINSVALRRSRAGDHTSVVYEEAAANRSPRSIALESVPSHSIEGDGTMRESAPNGILLEARGQIGWSLNESNARTIGSGGRTAFAAGGYWQPFRDLAFGVEGGMESYDQTLRYRNSDTLQIDQRPTYLWGGASLRYYLGALSIAELSPYVQTTLGGTSAGPMLRFRMGTEYDLGFNMSFLLSGEFSALFYTFDNQSLNSGRWGMTAGLQYSIR